MHTGTPFHFKLPQGNIHPRTCITPPSQRSRPCLFSQMDSDSPTFHQPSHPRVAHLTGDNSANGSVTMLSPSELSSSFFRPITPLQSQQVAGDVENAGSQNLVVSSEVDTECSDVLMDTSESAAVTRDGRNPIGEEHVSVSKTAAPSSEAVSSKGDEQSSRMQTPKQQSGTAVVPPTMVSESGSGRHAGTNIETVEELHDLSLLPHNSSSSKMAEPLLKTSSPEKQTTTQSSPRKCLSLRKTKNSPTPAKLRTANGAGLPSDKTIQPVLNGATCSKTGVRPFVLGVHPLRDAQSEAQQNSCESQGLLPPINIPNDSQFELSESLQFSPPTFRIERPSNPSHHLNIPPSSMTRHLNTSAKTSIFSNLGASSRKKATSLVTAVSSCRSARVDPYQFHSQDQNSDVAQFMRRKDLSSKGRKGGDEGERRGIGEGSEPTVNCNSIRRSEEEGGFMRGDSGIVSEPNLCQNEDVHPLNAASQDVANSTASTHRENRSDGEEGDRGGGMEASSRDYSEVARPLAAPAAQRETSLSVTLNPSQHAVPSTDPQQPAISPLVVGTSPSLDPSTTTPVTSPTSPTLQGSALQFVSPSVVASNLGLEQWVQQAAGGGGGSYEIQYVRTYTIECKVVSSHVIKDERVMAGSERAWQVRDQ